MSCWCGGGGVDSFAVMVIALQVMVILGLLALMVLVALVVGVWWCCDWVLGLSDGVMEG